MGTSIDCFIPKNRTLTIIDIEKELNRVFLEKKPDFIHLEKYGQFTNRVTGKWFFNHIPKDRKYPEHIIGKGDGFFINIYENVVNIGSVERISSLYLEEKNISKH